ncbi:cysteine desulfurase [Fulvivirgaceae bacterium BMA12]|uniref:Probable cysteine desulfurase n=1 Tax=Agaribacillus aureus TaxID=3051825 RepID=A0ABT8L389_9BACT|nr:cysteine desulfurase [Fulvivirgaceae bacterium BMA12]
MGSHYETLNKDILDVQKIREEFPILHQEVNGKPLVYFDNAATTQKPIRVINALTEYYSGYNANIHRGIHTLAEKATSAFEDTRKAVKDFINAREVEEVIFTYGTTDGINLVASTFGRANINEGDEVIISSMEHHSNIVPWQMLCEEKGAKLKVIPINEKGEIIFEAFEKMLSEKTKLVSIVHVSNTLGTINPVKAVVDKAHEYGAAVLIDGAQASAHINIDMQALDCDFYVFSLHKLFGPTGSGILYGKRSFLEAMPPFRGGGEMIKEVTFEKTTYNDIPYKFEAGTPNIADVVAIKKALEFVEEYGKDNIAKYEDELLRYGNEQLQTIPGLKFIGTAQDRVSVISFIIEGIHHFDIGMMMDARGVALRTGHHCTQPLMDIYNIEGTVRASLSLYNTFEEIDIMVEGLKNIVERFK